MECLDDGDLDENQLQACFVLHRGLAKTSENGSASPRRQAGKSGIGSDSELVKTSDGLPSIIGEPSFYGTLRWQAFHAVWGRVQKLIEDIEEGENQEAFNAIQQWICNRQFSDAQLSVYHSARLVSNGSVDPGFASNWPKDYGFCGKQLQTALVFLGGINPSDHRRIFAGLTRHLKAHKCHVARLTSVDFQSKTGVGGPLRSLFRQLIPVIPEVSSPTDHRFPHLKGLSHLQSLPQLFRREETTDMEILAAWHREAENQGLPMSIVVEDPESCDPKILAEFFVVLSEWIGELPIVLIMGIATAEDAIRRLLPANTLARLHLWRFTLKDPQKLLELIIRAVLVEAFCAFELSHEVVLFLYGYFETHDLSVTSIMRSLKVACVELFWNEPLSFLCRNLLTANSKADLEEQCASLPEVLLSHVSNFPSVKGTSSCSDDEVPYSERMASSLWQLRPQKQIWAMAFQCLSTLGKYAGVHFGELLCRVLQWVAESANTSNNDEKLGPLEQIISKLRDMSVSSLKSTLEEWRKVTLHDKELNAEVSQILSELCNSPATGDVHEAAASHVPCKAPSLEMEGVQAGVNQQFKSGVISRSALRRLGHQQTVGTPQVGLITTNKKAEDFLRRVLREHVKPADSRPFREVFCFKDVHILRQALVGETRRKIHMDLLNSRNVLKCDCCPADGELSSTLHDTTLAYILSQEYGDLIRVHNWYQAFAAVCHPQVQGSGGLQEDKSPSARKGRLKQIIDVSPEEEGASKKKRGRSRKSLDSALEKESEEMKRPRLSDPVLEENAPIQARFTRAATELQIVGLLQMPKKGNSETVRRICI